MSQWPGPEKDGEVIYTVCEYPTEDVARERASMFNRELAGNMWEFRYIVQEVK
jgi:hypothetical protein